MGRRAETGAPVQSETYARISYWIVIPGCRGFKSHRPPTHHVDQIQETHRGRFAGRNGRRSNGASGRLCRRSEPDTQGHAFKYGGGGRGRGSGRNGPRTARPKYVKPSGATRQKILLFA